MLETNVYIISNCREKKANRKKEGMRGTGRRKKKTIYKATG